MPALAVVLAVAAPAHAGPDDARPCVLVAAGSGGSFTGLLGSGPAAGDLRCDLLVDGVPAGTTSGTGVVVPVPVTFAVPPGAVVTLCATVGVTTRCETASSLARLGYDLVNTVLESSDLMVCPYLALLPGTYGPVAIDGTGDLRVDGALWFDCPPYEEGGAGTPGPDVLLAGGLG